ncbi:hypothetical protein [Prosthecobacter sp.]|uniref:hypothetical protein n=1 Tax=Prosthecobacter sp. TaxID=1965333 RepID=UPI0037838643
MTRIRYLASLLLGIFIGAGFTAAYLKQPGEGTRAPSKHAANDAPGVVSKEPPKEMSKRRQLALKVFHPHPAGWLFPPDFHIEAIIPDASDLQVLQAPDRVTLHPVCKADTPGAITIAGFHFSPQGTALSGDPRSDLLEVTRSLGAYGPPSMCSFRPGVLMHCERSGHVLDLLFCFSCDDVYAFKGEKHERAFGAGMSDLGRRLFLEHFTKALPQFTELKDLYQAYDLPASTPHVELR